MSGNTRQVWRLTDHEAERVLRRRGTSRRCDETSKIWRLDRPPDAPPVAPVVAPRASFIPWVMEPGTVHPSRLSDWEAGAATDRPVRRMFRRIAGWLGLGGRPAHSPG